MKKALFVLFITIGIISCKKDSISHQDEFEKSYKAWLAFKQTTNNSYTYTVNWGSWTGYGSETVLKVKDGVIVSRQFTATQLVYPTAGGAPTKQTVRSWLEVGATVNTHDKNEGAAALITLDEVYDKARNIWLKADKKENEVYFEARNNGMISDCGYIPKNCQDDCSIGISISSIKAE